MMMELMPRQGDFGASGRSVLSIPLKPSRDGNTRSREGTSHFGRPPPALSGLKTYPRPVCRGRQALNQGVGPTFKAPPSAADQREKQ
jgi:hypothetical protein